MTTDVAIVGGGPGGSICALELLRRGIRPVIIEGAEFPRFSIGESLTGEVGSMLRELGLGDAMDASGFPVKHGVKVWGKGSRNSFYVPVQRRAPEGLQPATTWQVLRSSFDQTLLDVAIARGATVVRATARDVVRSGKRISGLVVEQPDGTRIQVQARFVADASGRATFLASRGVTGTRREAAYKRQVALFAHVHGARRGRGPRSGDTLIFYRERHQWAWFIPVGPEATSIGLVLPTEQVRRAGSTPADFFWDEVRRFTPPLETRLERATLSTSVRTLTNYSYTIDDFAGPGFTCIGDAHRFIDPIFSFGVLLTMKEAAAAAESIAASFDETDATVTERFRILMEKAETAQDIIASLVDVFWAFPLAFQRMAHRTHRDGLADIFAGRLDPPPKEADPTVATLHRLRATAAGRTAAPCGSD